MHTSNAIFSFYRIVNLKIFYKPNLFEVLKKINTSNAINKNNLLKKNNL